MKKLILLVFAVFLSTSLFYYDAYGKSDRNRKVIKTIVINKNAHGSATVDRSIFSDVKAFLCEETHAVEIDFFEVSKGDIYIMDSNGEIVKGYVFDTAPINRDNYIGYFSSNNIKVENFCVHDNNSFFIRNGQIIDTKSYTYFATISEPTCVTNGLNEVTCNYCGSHYNVFSPSDPNAHNFINGNCIYCGKEDPNYVFTEDVSERRPA